MCPVLCVVVPTIALFSVTSLVILNEFCRLLFVLTMFINRLNSLTRQSSGRLNGSLIYIFLFMGPSKQGVSQRRFLKHTHLHIVHSSDRGCQSSVSQFHWIKRAWAGVGGMGELLVKNCTVSLCESCAFCFGTGCLLFPKSERIFGDQLSFNC